MSILVDPLLQAMVDKYPRLFHGSTPPAHNYAQPGWKPLVDDLFFAIDGMPTDEQARNFAVRQIKEKLGALRFYISFATSGNQPLAEKDSKDRPEAPSNGSVDSDSEAAAMILANIQDAIDRFARTC